MGAPDATVEPRPVSTQERAAMRRVLLDYGFEHAPGSCAHALAVELVETYGRADDARLEKVALEIEWIVVDVLVGYARENGWKARR